MKSTSPSIRHAEAAGDATPSGAFDFSQFFTTKTIGTVAGSAGAVWVTCMVLYNLIPENSLGYLAWRWIAFSLSELIVILLLLKLKTRTTERWLIAVLNGFIVFINASGINAVSTGLPFNKNDTLVKHSSLIPFAKDISWWPDITLLKRIEELESRSAAISPAGNIELQPREPVVMVDTTVIHDTLRFVNIVQVTKTDTAITVSRSTMPSCDELRLFDKWVISFLIYNDRDRAGQEFDAYRKALLLLDPLKGKERDILLVRDPETENQWRMVIDMNQGRLSQDSVQMYIRLLTRYAKVRESKIYSQVQNSVPFYFNREYFQKTYGRIVSNPDCIIIE